MSFSNDLSDFIKMQSPKIQSGQLIVVLKQKGETKDGIIKIVNEFSSLTKQIDQPFILGCPENDDDLLQEASELSSLEKIKATNQKLVGDAVTEKN